MQMAETAEVSIVVWSRYIALKLFRRTLENDIMGPCFTLFTRNYKNFANFSVLKQVLPKCTIVHNY